MTGPVPLAQDPSTLTADCAGGLYGAVLRVSGFDAGDDFAFDKRALAPCRHLGTDNLCRIHETLSDQAFRAVPSSTARAPDSM